MNENIRVFIATTQGPSEVQRLAEEDPSVRSVICLQGKAIALPVSPDYDAFVRRPTGVIEAVFGHPAYRLDLAQPVTGGLSWQLGALVVHGLHAEGRLAGRDEDPQRVLWATGEVDRELKLLPVEHLAQKIQSSAELFRALLRDRVPVTLCLPEDNRDELEAVWAEATGLSLDQVEVLAAGEAAALFAGLGLDAPSIMTSRGPQGSTEIVPENAVAGKGPAQGKLWAALSLLGVVGLAYAVFHWTGAMHSVGLGGDAAVEGKFPFGLTALEIRAPADATCAAVLVGSVTPLETETELPLSGRRTSTQLDRLCRLHYRATNLGMDTDLWLVGARAGESADLLHTKTFLSAQRLARDQSQSFEVNLPRHFDETLVQRFALVARPLAAQTDKTFDHYAGQLSERPTLAAWRDWLAGVRSGGFSVEVAQHALAP